MESRRLILAIVVAASLSAPEARLPEPNSRVRVVATPLGPQWREGMLNRLRTSRPCYVVDLFMPRASPAAAIEIESSIRLQDVLRLEVFAGPVTPVPEWAGRQSETGDGDWRGVDPEALEAAVSECADPLASTLPGTATPQEVARAFLEKYLKKESSGGLDAVPALAPFLSQRLLRALNDADACQKDWGKQQPKDSTDKPPFVDCCLFASSPEGTPSAFKLGPTEVLADRRYKIFVDFTYDEALETRSWRDAVILAESEGRYSIDDFLFLRDAPKAAPTLLSESFEGCRGPRWTGRN